MTSKRYEIADLVEKLGPILTNPEADKRRKGVHFLSQVLSQLPVDFLTDGQLKFILAFYNDRLKDHHSLVPYILSGVQTLSQMAHAPEEDVLRVLITILSGSVITCQSQQREERSKIFDLIILCSIKYYDTLIRQKNDYIQGVINAIEGERDPRNLVKLFTFMPTFVEKYPLDHWADEMFEVFACYYPIDFYPSANDPNAITRDGLAEKLEQCLLACKDFIEPALVLSLEKLETQLKVAKLDSLAMIRNCALKFGCVEIEEKFETIWMTVKQELLPGSNDDIIRSALETAAAIVQSAKEESVRTNLLTIIFNSIAISLCDVSLRLFYPALRVASAVGKSGPEAAVYIGDKVAPILLRQLKDCEDDTGEKERTLLGLLKDITCIANEKKCLSGLDQEILREVEAVFVTCLTQHDEAKRIIGYFGLVEICQQTQVETRKVIYSSLLDALRNGQSSKIPVTSCVLPYVEHFSTEVVLEFVNPIITDPSSVTERNCNEIFRTLCTLLGPSRMNNMEIYKYLLGHILIFPDTTLNLDDEMEGDQHSRVLLVLLTSLNELLKDKNNVHVAINLYGTHNLVDQLMNVRDKFRGDTILNALSTFLMYVVSAQTADQQTKDIDKYLPLLQVTTGSNNDLYFINGLLSKCSNEVSLEGKFEPLVMSLVQLGLVEGNTSKVEVCAHLLCFLFNRNSVQGDTFDRVLVQAVTTIQQSMTATGQGMRTLAWITKGLLTKGHPKAEELVLKIINDLHDPNLSSSAADAFECLAQTSPMYLPNERMFYKQKLFDLVCKTLVTPGKQLDVVQLKALSRVLGELSPVVLRMHLTKVGQILFQCLNHEDMPTVHTTLKLFVRLIETDEKFCQDHIQFLIPQLLKLSQVKGNMVSGKRTLNGLLD